jgi:hypothetical protein
MNPVAVVVILEVRQSHFQIRRGPEQKLVQTFSANRSDQSLNKRMRQRNVGNGFDFRYAEHS